jgi:two-component system, chemotaxis family, chemotaxis protein CheY
MYEFKVDDKLLAESLAESREQLTAVESDLLTIEKDGAEIDEERINRVFRTVHTIKGAAGLMDLAKVGELAHRTENVLALVRSRKLAPTPDNVQVLLRANDRLSELLDNPDTSNQADISELVSALTGLYEDHKTPLRASGTKAGSKGFQDGSLRVLLVEDDFASRLLLQTFLSRYGECHIAVNGREAVDACRSALDRGQGYNLICMDIMMPEMDGREAVRQVRALEEAKGILSTFGAKIFMTTTVEEVKEVVLCFRELCDAYLMKPIDLGQLLSRMKSHQLVS